MRALTLCCSFLVATFVVTAGGAGDDEVVIRAAEAKLADALNRGQFDTAMTAFAPDAVLHVEGVPPREGRDAVRAHLEAVHAQGLLFRIEITRVVVSGDLAVAFGIMGVTAPTAAGGRTSEYPGKVVSIWHKRQGTWVILARAPTSNGPRPPLPERPR